MSNNKENSNLPHRDAVTNFQINTLLNAVGLLANVLTNPPRDIEGVPQHLDGGSKCAAEASFINVCSRIDEIVSDPTRWGFHFQEHLEYKLGELYQQEINLRNAQQRAIEEVNSPHRVYGPTLVKLKDGTFAAVLGDINDDIEKCIVGVGVTPEEAIKAFDEVFKGEPSQAMINWLAKKDAEEKKPKRKKKDDTHSKDSH